MLLLLFSHSSMTLPKKIIPLTPNAPIDAIQALIEYQTMLQDQAKAILEPAEAAEALAKAAVHDARITYNRLMKRAETIGRYITLEQKEKLEEAKQVKDEWSVKSNDWLEKSMASL